MAAEDSVAQMSILSRRTINAAMMEHLVSAEAVSVSCLNCIVNFVHIKKQGGCHMLQQQQLCIYLCISADVILVAGILRRLD